MISEILNQIRKTKIIAIVRNIPFEYLSGTLQALYQGGIRNVEITFNSPDTLEMIRFAREHYGTEMLIGAGTVLDAETARSAILAGADFVLAPTLDIDTITMCSRYSRLAVPGTLTPTEILKACEAGAQLIKVFPVGPMGPHYIKDVLSPLPQVNLLPVGGVNLTNADELFACGAFALGIGSDLVDRKLIMDGEYSKISSIAQKYMDIANKYEAAMK